MSVDPRLPPTASGEDPNNRTCFRCGKLTGWYQTTCAECKHFILWSGLPFALRQRVLVPEHPTLGNTVFQIVGRPTGKYWPMSRDLGPHVTRSDLIQHEDRIVPIHYAP